MGKKVGKKKRAAPAPPDREGTWILLLGLVVLAIALGYGHLAAGAYQDDDIDRYFMARQVWHDPSLLLDRWGMPLVVALFALPAKLFGYGGVEAITALATAGAAALTALAARRLGLSRPWIAGVFFFFQPMVLNLSYSGLAEPVGALLVAAILWSWYGRRPAQAVLWASLLPLARIETGVLTLIVLAAAWGRVGWRIRAAALLPVLAWNGIGFAMTGEPLFLISTSGARPLNSLGVFHYLRNEILVAGPVVLFFWWWAMAALAEGTRPASGADTRPAVGAASESGERMTPTPSAGFPVLAAVLAAAHFVVLTLLAWETLPIGRSIGFLRHVVASAPALALTAYWGARVWVRPASGRRWSRAELAVTWPAVVAIFLSHRLIADSFLGEGRVEWRWVVTAVLALAGLALMRSTVASRPRAAAVIAAGIGAALVALLVVRPIGLDPERQAIQRAVTEIRGLGLENAVTYTNHPWFAFLSGRDRYDLTRTPRLTQENLETAAPGSVILWENHYGARLWGDVEDELLSGDSRYMPLLRLTAGLEQNFRVAVYLRGR